MMLIPNEIESIIALFGVLDSDYFSIELKLNLIFFTIFRFIC